MLPTAVMVAVAALCGTSVLAGTASVRAVTTQDRLVRLTSTVTEIVAESGRAEALVAGLADPNTNPADLLGMRVELAASARSIGAAAAVLDGRSAGRSDGRSAGLSDGLSIGLSEGRSDGTAGGLPEGDAQALRAVLARTGSQLPVLTREFAVAANGAAQEGAQLSPGSLLRGDVDGIYPVLRSSALSVVRVLLSDAEAQRRSWSRTVVVTVLSLAVTGLLLAGLVVGPVRVRLRRQRLAAAQMAQADRDTLRFVSQILDAMDVSVVAASAAGSEITVNQAARQLFALPDGVAITAADLEAGSGLRPPDGDAALAWTELPLARALRTRSSVVMDLMLPPGGPAGSARRFKARAELLLAADGRPLGAVATFEDLTDLHARNDELTRHAAQLAAIGRATAAILRQEDARAAVCEAARSVSGAEVATLLEHDGAGYLVCTAAAGAEAIGLRMSLSGRSLAAEAFALARTRTTLNAIDDTRVDQAMVAHLSEKVGTPLDAGAWIPVVTSGRCRGVLVLGFAAGTPVHEHLPVLEILAEETAVALERHDIMRQLAADAGTDPLTGVANRRSWEVNLDAALAEARAGGHSLCVVMLDLDHFKRFNDEYGHPAGDTLLHEVATAWSARLRPGDLLARFGGEEFTVILPRCRADGATRVANELRSLVPWPQTCSAGTAEWDGTESGQELVARADRALYDSKRAGRDRTTTAVR